MLVSYYSYFVLHLLKFSFLNLFFFHIPFLLFFTLSLLVPLFSRCSSNVVPHVVFLTLLFALFLLRYFSLGVNIFFCITTPATLQLSCRSSCVAPFVPLLSCCTSRITPPTLFFSHCNSRTTPLML